MPAHGPAEGSAIADGHPAQVTESAELPKIELVADRPVRLRRGVFGVRG
jgi:hypothetical protein